MTERNPTTPKLDRRAALKGLAAGSVVPLVPGCVPEGGDDDSTPAAGTVRDRIDTVVVLMMENRSFDHYFGALSLEEGRTDVDGLTTAITNVHPDGGAAAPYLEQEHYCLEDPPHGWSSVHAQWNEGAMDGFVTEYRDSGAAGDSCRRVMGYFNRSTLGPLYALADGSALCQRWFCSVLGPTWPNRLYSHAATSGGATGNDFGDDRSMPTIYQRLDAAGIPWVDYAGNAPFLALFPGHFDAARFFPLEDFVNDATNGALPPLTIVEPIYGRNDDHPPTHPKAGEILISQVYNALVAGPHRDRFLLIVTYDEHGGFADHVAPPEVPDERAAEGFGRLGVRVPSVVIGPWVKRGHVSSTVYDHTSILAFLEHLWELEPLAARDAAANDLMDLIDTEAVAAGTPHAPIDLPPVEATDEEIYAEECVGEGITRDAAGPTHQPELEQLLDAMPQRHPADRRADTDAIYERMLQQAEAAGILVRR